MPHSTLKIIPGVDTNKTPVLNEAAISSCNLIRFIPDRNGLGLPQKLGGWSQFITSWASPSTVRALWAWEDTNNVQHMAIGSETNLYQTSGDPPALPVDISPQTYSANIAPSFSTTSGSSVVTIDDNNCYITGLDSVFIATQVAVGGLVLYGLYPCIFVSDDAYQIVARDVLGNPQAATSTVTGGGTIATLTTTSGSSIVTVTLADHGLSAGDTFPIYVPTTVGGITLSGNYIVNSVPSTATFTVLAGNAASSGATASLNGGKVRLNYYIGSGALPTSTGYGVGGYGVGGFGTGVIVSSGRVLTTTATSGTGSVATVTVSGIWDAPSGSIVTIAGVTPSGYNGTWTILSSTPGASTSTITFASTATGVQTVAGTVTVIYWRYPTVLDWTLDNWGEALIVCPFNGAIFQWQPESGTLNASIIPNAPVTNHGAIVAMPQRQIIAWGSTFNGINDPLLIRWCDVNDYSSWIATVANQAGSFRIPKGSKIIGAIQAPQQTLVWTDLAVWSMQYVGPPYVYQFNEIGNGCGMIAPKAAASVNGVVYWMGQSQFYRLAGNGVEPVRCPVWDVIFQDIDMDNTQKIRVAANSRFGEISWFYPTSPTGEITKYVKYNILLDQWDFGTLTRTAWINESIYGPPIGSDGSLVFQHETSENANGTAMNPSFRTGYFALSDGDQKIFVDEIWPDMKWGTYGGVASANVSITFYGADFPGQNPTQYGPYTVTQNTTYVNPRIRARLLSIEISSDDVDSFWRLGGIRYRSQPDGRY